MNDGLNQLLTLLADQAPETAQSLIQWHTTMAAIGIGISAGLILAATVSLPIGIGRMRRDRLGEDAWGIVMVILGASFLALGAPALVINAIELTQITNHPDVWLVDHLISGKR